MSSPLAHQEEHVLAPFVRDMLEEERSKILKMLSDLANLKAVSTGQQQRSRLEDIEQALQLALLEVQLELRCAAARS
jgi:hypothetical protein